MSEQGIDVSHHQDPNLFDWASFFSSKSFVIARCSYGDRPDEQFLPFAEACHVRAKFFGAYHFFRQQQGAVEQIKCMEKQLESFDYGSGNLFPALDMELNERWDGKLDINAHNTKGREIAEWIASRYGKCLIYISPGFWTSIGSPRWVLEHEIWVAHWDVKKPDSIGDRKHVIWQYENHGQCLGYPTPLDLNVCEDFSKITIPPQEDEDIDSEALTEKMEQMVERLIELQSQSQALHSNVLELQQELRELIDIVKD